jgi:hypothetical protein
MNSRVKIVPSALALVMGCATLQDVDPVEAFRLRNADDAKRLVSALSLVRAMPEAAAPWLTLAQCRWNNPRLFDAASVDAVCEISEANPSVAPAATLCGDLRMDRGDVLGAVAAWWRGVSPYQRASERYALKVKIGDALADGGDMDGAFGAWRGAIQDAPTQEDRYRLIVAISSASADPDAALTGVPPGLVAEARLWRQRVDFQRALLLSEARQGTPLLRSACDGKCDRRECRDTCLLSLH